MKVRVCYTTDVSDEYRRALRHSWGQHGTKATREELQRHLERAGESDSDDLLWDMRDCDEGCRA